MNKNIIVPLETAEYLGFDNEDDEIINIKGIDYKYIDILLFLEGIGVSNYVKLTINDLY